MKIDIATLKDLPRDELISKCVALATKLQKIEKIEEKVDRVEAQQNSMSKRLDSLERSCWRNAQDSRTKCTEVDVIPDNTRKEKVWEYASSATKVKISPDFLKSYYHFPFEESNRNSV